MLAQRAASEGPRWTRAVEDQSAPIPEEKTREFGEVSLATRYGLACGMARLSTPGWTGEKVAFLSRLQECSPIVLRMMNIKVRAHLSRLSSAAAGTGH
jgi:hypothetical protein